eukprot:15362247-Ditylum_brightwellii.AAC.1
MACKMTFCTRKNKCWEYCWLHHLAIEKEGTDNRLYMSLLIFVQLLTGVQVGNGDTLLMLCGHKLAPIPRDAIVIEIIQG